MASRSANVAHGVLVRQWTWPFRVLLWCLVIAVGVWGFTVAAQWGWARHSAPAAPLEHMASVLESDQKALARLQPKLFDPGQLAQWIGDGIYDTAVSTAIHAARSVMNVPGRSRAYFTDPKIQYGADPGGDFVRDTLADAGERWKLAVVGTYVFATRTAMYAASLPLVLLAGMIGGIDGLIARAKRKACAGRESASLYHRAKLGTSFVAIMGYLVCLGLPSLSTPASVLIPMATAMAALLRFQCVYYKKYP